MICGQTEQQVNFPVSLIVKVTGAAGLRLFLAELSRFSLCFSVEQAIVGNSECCIALVVMGSVGLRSEKAI